MDDSYLTFCVYKKVSNNVWSIVSNLAPRTSRIFSNVDLICMNILEYIYCAVFFYNAILT